MQNLQITSRPVASLQVYANNARLHSRKQIEKLKASIETFGWTNPLVIDEAGMVLCGAGRLEAARKPGMAEVPTIQLSHMSEADKKAYILADDRIAQQATWSKALLRDELSG